MSLVFHSLKATFALTTFQSALACVAWRTVQDENVLVHFFRFFSMRTWPDIQ
jgi:hypothetical protein